MDQSSRPIIQEDLEEDMEDSIAHVRSKFVLESIRIEKENTNDNVQQQVNEMDVDTNGKVDHFELRKRCKNFQQEEKTVDKENLTIPFLMN